MNHLTNTALAAILCTAFAVQAQDINPSWYLQPSVSVLKPDAGFGVDHNGVGGGLSFGKPLSQDWDVQLGGSYARSNSDGQRYQQQLLSANALYFFSRDTFRPFVLAGAGVERDHSNLQGNVVDSGNAGYASVGLGFQIALADQWALQADLRKVHGFLRDDHFSIDRSSNYYLTFGLNYAFGTAAPAPRPAPPVQLAPPPPPPVVVAPPPKPEPAPVPAPRFEKITLGATELFAFDSSTLKTPQPRLDEIAAALRANAAPRGITVSGYTDRIGSAQYNQKLSQRRADAVKAYLVGQGVPAERINASGKGASNPVVSCDQQKGAALHQCLEPNRRVEVEQLTIERRLN